MAKNTTCKKFSLNIGDPVEIGEEVFDDIPHDSVSLQDLGYHLHTTYYIKWFWFDSRSGFMKATIHPDPTIRTLAELASAKNPEPVSIARHLLLKDCGSPKKSLDFMLQSGRKTCPFCKHGENLRSRKDGTVYCNSRDHVFAVWKDSSGTKFRMKLGDAIVNGLYDQNYFEYKYGNIPFIVYKNPKPRSKLIYRAVLKIKTLNLFS